MSSYPGNIVAPISKPESEMTDEEKNKAKAFFIAINAYRISDNLKKDTLINKSAINAIDDFIKK